MTAKTTLIMVIIGFKCFSQQSLESILQPQKKQAVSYIFVNDIKEEKEYIFLDAREPKEYIVSHIPNAINIGYNNFKVNELKDIIEDKNAPVIVYCSIGVRSGKIGERLLKLGYNNVQNLYGGIFEWKNQGRNLVDTKNVSTTNVHTFSKRWSRFLTSGNAVYEK